MELISTLLTIAGFSLKDVLRPFGRLRANTGIVKKVSNYLARLEEAGDPISGMWTLQEWNVTFGVHHPHHEPGGLGIVTGFLAVLYQSEPGVWQCSMYLQYRKHISNFMLFLPGNGRAAHLFKRCFTGIYDVELRRDNTAAGFTGRSALADSVWPIATSMGRFSNTRVEEGALKGHFENTGIYQGSKADFEFSGRQPWKELHASL
jgi:hypothetical protein